ncbi:MAG: tetratricopeptide repeat protein [Spirochaetes bacterium]|nr:tetratricopeptide repeat protein [Spirochaetota bacterium]
MKKLLLIPCVIFLTISGVFASYEEALNLYEQNKYQDSLKMIAGELDAQKDTAPDSPNYKLRYLAAHNHWKLKNATSAVAHLKICADIQKNNPNPLIDLSLIFLENKKYADAGQCATKAISLKESALPYYVLANISLDLKNYWKAKEYFEKAISIDPGLDITYNGLGITLMNLARFSEANTAFSAALAMSPDSPEIQNNIAVSLKKLGKINEAYRYSSSAAARRPDNPVIKKNQEAIKIIIDRDKTQ